MGTRLIGASLIRRRGREEDGAEAISELNQHKTKKRKKRKRKQSTNDKKRTQEKHSEQQ